MASDGPASPETLSGLTAAQAQEFHKVFIGNFAVFVLIATVAHILVWAWRPWIPGEGGYSSLESAFASLGPILTNLA